MYNIQTHDAENKKSERAILRTESTDHSGSQYRPLPASSPSRTAATDGHGKAREGVPSGMQDEGCTHAPSLHEEEGRHQDTPMCDVLCLLSLNLIVVAVVGIGDDVFVSACRCRRLAVLADIVFVKIHAPMLVTPQLQYTVLYRSKGAKSSSSAYREG